jgi:hypothetical protein
MGSPPKVCEGLARLKETVEVRRGVSYNFDQFNFNLEARRQ